MIPLELQTPVEVLAGITERARALRIARGWTQQELADRSNVALDTLRRFERTGKIALERLVRIAVVLDAVGPLGALFAPPPAATLADLERAERRRVRAPARRRLSP
ncbi:MAG TPA: helix-turn-helix transcriptional regulator [Longimicrobium sp.]|jgi:transcriptional regulator with XRE-family HTH domain|nr:helix-turn-helix transcriptional regulator [Longimicrobium sp.]